MRIGMTGAQGVGKSTLLKGMFGWEELNGHAFIQGLTRLNAKSKGIKINEEGNFEGQKTLVNSLAWHLKTLQNLVIDRTLIDVYAYTRYMKDRGNLNTQELNYIRNRARQYQPMFDAVFYIRPEFPPTADGYRSADPGFAAAMAGLMEDTIGLEPLGTQEVIILTGTVEERLTGIKNWITQYESRVRCNPVSTEAPDNSEVITQPA